MSCVTGVTGTTKTIFYTQNRRIDILEDFGHALNQAQRESEKKLTVAS